MERRRGNSKLVYDKARRTIVTVRRNKFQVIATALRDRLRLIFHAYPVLTCDH